MVLEPTTDVEVPGVDTASGGSRDAVDEMGKSGILEREWGRERAAVGLVMVRRPVRAGTRKGGANNTQT